MKKILIALSLVLVMLLSLVPVFAEDDANTVVTVYYRVFKDPARKVPYVDFNYSSSTFKLDKAIAADKAALAKLVVAQAMNFPKPNLNFTEEVKWDVEATEVQEYVAPQTKTTQKVVHFTNVGDLQANLKSGANYELTVTKGTGVQDNMVLTQAGLDALQAAINKNEKTFAVEPTYAEATNKLPQEVIVNVVDETVKEKMAFVKIDIFPLCYGQEKPGKPCVHLCEQITVRAFDARDGKEIKALGATYDVNVKEYPRFDAILNDYLNVRLPMLGHGQWQVLKTWSGADSIALPNWFYVGKPENGPCKEDLLCTILVQVLPVWQDVDVYHIFQDCCKDPDGKVSYSIWKTFYEHNVRIDFITFNTQLMINQDKAAEFAKTRIEKINAKDFVFDHAEFSDGINLDGYMQGTVYNLNGQVIDVVENSLPEIDLYYLRAECVQKAEEKVDNATVNNNAAAPASANANNAGQLPATGVKDVTAFFLSAVALLGLGVFFAKKH